ncbi:hypothetical protein Poli38472_013204 [Pythium oligandrum]|uniref:Tubulin polyglutamylase complex subunit 1-like C-terminal domain-containing protein n=1 Tax=Pythium oligandrum TaxID=41045 RepID=A0A8K1C2S2_PYTOL|nr:hypothetical protein Poli38472_013204 [Pythium oligandrum]|eukprot:TMW55313.1 hypothetical protein Poli38472_013204 [Pythium oligandrum]
MGDDYLVRSGAKDLLTHAVATLLETRPSNPVAFLAHHFDASADRVTRCVRLLQAGHLHSPSFEDTIYRAFQLLGASGQDGLMASQEAARKKQTPVNGTPVILPRGSLESVVVTTKQYHQVLGAMSAEIPSQIKHRFLAALQLSSESVEMGEFQRGVRACLLFEELLDAVQELFVSVDKGGLGEAKLILLLSALENAVQHSKTRESDHDTLVVLKAVLQEQLCSLQDVKNDESGTPRTNETNGELLTRYIRLSELQDILLHVILRP